MRHKEHHKREMLFLMSYLVIFFIVFALAMFKIEKKLPVFGIGLSYLAEDLIILVLSFIAMLKVIWEIIKY